MMAPALRLFPVVCILLLAGSSSSTLRLHPPLAIDDWDRGHELPDLVAGRFFGNHIFLRVENTGAERLRGVRLRVKGSAQVREAVGEVVDLQPGQRSSVHAPLSHPEEMAASVEAEDCPVRVQLAVETAGGEVLAEKEQRLLCRQLDDRFSFVYIDADGSPQLAAAKFPAVSLKTNRSGCPRQGCAVLLSTHGMDVTAQRQADCYRPKQGAWVLAPHGRGTHGFNWQGPGHWSALHALEALSERAKLWRDPAALTDSASIGRLALASPPRVIFTGHSNGGFGAWFFGSHYPDYALGVAPLAGMATMGTTEAMRPHNGLNVPDRLWEVIDRSVEEYRGDALAPNLLGRPFLARTGSDDRVIDPRSTRRMLALLGEAAAVSQPDDSRWEWTEKKSRALTKWEAVRLSDGGDGSHVDATVVELAGKEHWWWDTRETNDGGVMDDNQMRAFWKRALAIKHPATAPFTPAAAAAAGSKTATKLSAVVGGGGTRFVCANLASCGSSAGVKLLQQQRPGISSSSFSLMMKQQQQQRHDSQVTGGGNGTLWELHTENVQRLRIDATVLEKTDATDGDDSTERQRALGLVIDGQSFALAGGSSRELFCREEEEEEEEEGAGAVGTWQHCGDEAACGIYDINEQKEKGKGEAEEAEAASATGGSTASCCREVPLRSAERAAGPIRRVFASPFAIVYGTSHPSPKVAERYKREAVRFANAWSAVGGGVTRVIADTELIEAIGNGGNETAAVGGNLVVFGGAESNAVARALQDVQPAKLLSSSAEPAAGAGEAAEDADEADKDGKKKTTTTTKKKKKKMARP